VGNERNTSFWEAAWRGDLAFRYKYPRLFSLSNQKEAKVGDFGVASTTEINWKFPHQIHPNKLFKVAFY